MVSIKHNIPKKSNTRKAQKPSKIEKTKKIKPNQKTTPKPLSSIQHELDLEKSVSETKKSVKKVKYVMPSKSVTEELVNLSLNALQQLTIQYQKKKTILEDELQVFLEINAMKIQNVRGNIKFILPHSTVSSTGEICLITPDLKKGRKVDHEPSIEHWEEILREAGVKSVKTVLPLRQLRVEYDQFELRRRLMTQHDFIMVDTRVLNHASHVLGNRFFKKHNMLIPIRVNEKKNLKKDIENGIRTTILRMGQGATSTVTVGHTAMPQEHLKANIISLVMQLKDKFPGGEANVRSISLKLPLSLSLPLYITLRPSSTVIAPKLKTRKPKHFTEVEGELSTLPGRTVKVAPDGTVHLYGNADSDEEMEDNSDQEPKAENSSLKRKNK